MDSFYAMITPIAPPSAGGSPPGIWGPPGPWPSPPIYLPPGAGAGVPPGLHPMPPIYYPPGIWGPPGPWPSPPIYLPPSNPGGPGAPIVLPPRPEHPIFLPPDKPGDPPKPAEGWDWVWSPVYGWVVQPPGEGGKPQPPAGAGAQIKK